MNPRHIRCFDCQWNGNGSRNEVTVIEGIEISFSYASRTVSSAASLSLYEAAGV